MVQHEIHQDDQEDHGHAHEVTPEIFMRDNCHGLV
jgi:hypothetical protein